jgi:hypothetical protein
MRKTNPLASTTDGGQQKISFYQLLNTPISVGDEFLYGVWANSQTANGFNLRGHPKAANEGHLKTGQRK